MTYKEAQEQSPCGVAVWGNFAMRDVVWPKGELTPYWFIKDGYVPVKLERVQRFVESDLWTPIDDPAYKMRKRNVQ